jgi:CBS domain-containing protein
MIRLLDLMVRDMVTVSKKASLGEAAAIMLEKGIGSALVEDKGEIIGIVTERDFVKSASMRERPERVDDIMTAELTTIDSDGGLLDAIELMESHGLRHLLVEENREIIGLISFRDILRAVATMVTLWE